MDVGDSPEVAFGAEVRAGLELVDP